MMQSNPMQMLIAMLRSGGNPSAALMQMARSNPQVNQVITMLNGKTPAQQKTIAENMARERGLNLEDVMRQMGLQIPSDR